MTPARSISAGLASLFAAGTAAAWTPGTYPAPSRDLTVDRFQRNDVLSFWHGVYQASEGFQSRMGWTGSYATGAGAEGTTSPAFIADMERRLNYFRAMSGVPANARMNTNSTVVIFDSDPHKPSPATLKAAAVQRAALMLTMSYNANTPSIIPAEYSHTPPVTATWTAVPWNATNKGNLGINVHGPHAIDSYMAEEVPNAQSGENSAAGHRRWLMRSTSTNFATGDIPGFFNQSNLSTRRAASNVLYVVQRPEEMAAVAPAFVAYPSPGFFPAPLNTRFWSLTYPGANFGSATVAVTQVGGSAVSATVMSRNFPAGDPAITWMVPEAHAARSFPEDRSYDVTVSGIDGAGVPATHSYRITFVNPDILTSDQTLSGTSVPHPPTPAKYTFTPPPFTEALRVNTYREIPVAWTENAETTTISTVVARTSGTYPFLSPGIGSFSAIAGSRSFRLTHPNRHPPITTQTQIFDLGRKVLPGKNAALKFTFRRGFMAMASKLDVESSSDGGATWTKLGATISGVSDSTTDSSPTNASIPVPFSATPLLIRFRYYATPGLIYDHEDFPTQPTGIFIDTITMENSKWLEPRKTNELDGSATTFTLDTTTQGGPMVIGDQWHLALQTKLGDRWFPDGPLKQIVPAATPPLTPYELWVLDHPGLLGSFDDDYDDDGVPNGVEYAFFADPTKPTILKTEVIIPPGANEFSIQSPLASPRDGITYEAECSESLAGEWTSEGVKVTIGGGFIKATAPMPPSGRCFIRWKITLL